MAQNNNNNINNLEYPILAETTYTQLPTKNAARANANSQQSLTGFAQYDNTILQQQSMQSSSCVIIEPLCQSQIQSASSSTLVSNQVYQECTSSNGLPSQQINSQLHQSVTQTQFVSNAINYTTIISPIKNTMVVESQTNFQTQDMENNLPNVDPQQNTSTSQLVPFQSQPNCFAIEQESQVTTAANPKISVIQENEKMKSPQTQTKSCLSDTTNTSKSNVALSAKNSNSYTSPVELQKNSSSGFRVAEFVLKHLDSVPGEEKFYNWSNKTKDFASSQPIQENFYAQKINSNVVNSSNFQDEIDWSRDRASGIELSDNSGNETSPKKKEKSGKNASWIAERDRILKKYSHKLMRKKPKSWQSRKRSTHSSDP